jgi:hypothetical protein
VIIALHRKFVKGIGWQGMHNILYIGDKGIKIGGKRGGLRGSAKKIKKSEKKA